MVMLAFLGLGLMLGYLAARAIWRKQLHLKEHEIQENLAALSSELQEHQHTVLTYREQTLQLQAQQAQLQQSLLTETERRATYAEQAHRIPILESELAEKEQHLARLRHDLAEHQADLARLQTELNSERQAAAEKLALLHQAETELKQAFQALAVETLQANNELFLRVASSTLERYQVEARADLEQRRLEVENLVRPLAESLARYEQEIRTIEHERQRAYVRLSQQVESLGTAQANLIGETGKLIKALRLPQVRGRWGEMTLRRVVELAGMTQHCDFTEQPSLDGEGGRLRPDLVIHLPGSKILVIDAKAPLQSYLDALESESDEERRKCLGSHARQIRTHMQQLGSKSYWGQFEQTPEFVVLFLPGETFFSAALEQDPQLIEAGVGHRVILATPTTLIALLRAVAYGWQQQAITENALAISRLGKELYERLCTMASHFQELGRGLQRSVRDYNKAVGNLENRVLVTARKFQELGVSVKQEIPLLQGIEDEPRSVAAPELNADSSIDQNDMIADRPVPAAGKPSSSED
jgi:DNA recombination protein RmuC